MLLIGVIASFVYTLVGVSAFVTFLLFKNYAASVWAVYAGLLNAVTLHINWLAYKSQLDEWYGPSELKSLFWGSAGAFAIATSGFVYHVAMEILTSAPLLPIDKSVIISAIWAFLALKSGLMLMYFTHLYRRTTAHTPLTGVDIESENRLAE